MPLFAAFALAVAIPSFAAAAPPSAPLAITPAAPASLAPLVDQLSPAVVSIAVKQKLSMDDAQVPGWVRPFMDHMQMPETEGQGSGFLISADGYLLTNNHVVEHADTVDVVLGNERHFTARVVGTDPRTDVALLKIDAPSPLPFAELGDSSGVRVGDWSLAIGNPFGLDHSVTLGIVSAKGRAIGAGPYDDFLQTQAAINPGNSGGPLFDMQGRVIGINTAIVGQGIGFAIPIDQVKPLVEELKTKGSVSRGWLGVQLAEVDEATATQMGGKGGGVAVAEVTNGTPAQKSGLKAGDLVVALDGAPVKRGDDIVRAVGALKPGKQVKLDVIRDGKPQTLTAVLGERPTEDALARGEYGSGPAVKSPSAPPVVELDGTTVKAVDPQSRYEKRLAPGDKILKVDEKPVKDGASVQSMLAAPGGHRVLVQRGGRELFVIVPAQ